VKISLILRKIFENMAAESVSLPLKEGEFTCMFYANIFKILPLLLMPWFMLWVIAIPKQ
jgi:hypothetical protein